MTVNGRVSLTLLETYTSPSVFLEADKQEIIDVIKSTARFGLAYAENKYHAIIQAANDANEFGYIIDSSKGKSYAEYQAEKTGTSWKGKLKIVVDTLIPQVSSFSI